MDDTFQTIRCAGCGQLNRLRHETIKPGSFKCSKCGKALHSMIPDDGGKNATPASVLPIVGIVATLGLVMLVGSTAHRQSENTGFSRTPSGPTATIAKRLAPNPVREIETLIPAPPVFPVVPIPTPTVQLLESHSSASAKNLSRTEAPNPKAMVAPPTGDIQPRTRRNAIAPFTVLTESGQNYLIKLVNVDNAKDQIWIYVKGGESYSTKVPVGTYNLRAAAGNEWYGREDLFGAHTHFFRLRPKADAADGVQQMLQFRKERNRIVGMTISLKGIANGNMEQESMTRSEFDAN
jgi:hypothetical protein